MSRYIDDCLAEVGEVVWCKAGSTFVDAGKYYIVTVKRPGLFIVDGSDGSRHVNPSARFNRVLTAHGFPVTSLEGLQ